MTKKENTKLILKSISEILGLIILNIFGFILVISLALVNTFLAVISILFLVALIFSMIASFFAINDKIEKIKMLLEQRKYIKAREKLNS
jgi:hypothetical protein